MADRLMLPVNYAIYWIDKEGNHCPGRIIRLSLSRTRYQVRVDTPEGTRQLWTTASRLELQEDYHG